MPKICLYAEVLTHLRQLTLHASLETEKNEETKIAVSSDKKIITVIHDGESSSLYLPTQISGNANVTFPVDKRTEISARVQIDDLEQWQDTGAAGVESPWNAAELSTDTVLKCIECAYEIVPSGTVSAWKDLPSQHWADVMDMWFCHKPHGYHEPDNEKKAAEAKGFSSQSKLASTRGIGLVDLVSFVLNPRDCNINEINRSENGNSFNPTLVHCAGCHAQLGTFSSHDNLVRIDKGSVSVQRTRDTEAISYPPTTFIAAQILELIESTAMRKFIVYTQTEDNSTKQRQEPEVPNGTSDEANGGRPEEQKQETITSQLKENSFSTLNTVSLLLWIFNPDIYYSSSRLPLPPSPTSNGRNSTPCPQSPSSTPPTSSQQQQHSPPHPPPQQTTSTVTTTPSKKEEAHLPHRALKIFYSPLEPSSTLESYLSPTSTNTNTNTQQQTYEPLPLPPSSLTSLHKTLRTSTSYLPSSARTFQSWQVGLLDRYERHSTAERVMEMNPLARRVVDRNGMGLGMDGRPRVTRWELPVGAAELFR